jgi:hypothetical protein
MSGDVATVQLLLHHGAEVNKCDIRNETALMHSISYMHGLRKSVSVPDGINHIEVANTLVQANADVNICNIIGWSPLHAAAKQASPAMAKLLVDHGATLDACDNQGNRPVDVAFMRYKSKMDKQMEVASYLRNADLMRRETACKEEFQSFSKSLHNRVGGASGLRKLSPDIFPVVWKSLRHKHGLPVESSC